MEAPPPIPLYHADTWLPAPPANSNVEDLALTFIEEVIGRHDWKRNWKTCREGKDVVQLARVWLEKYSLVEYVQATELVQWLDDYVSQTVGEWR